MTKPRTAHLEAQLVKDMQLEVAALTRKLDLLRKFARDIMICWPEGGIEGGDLQETAIECGLLIPCDCGGAEECAKEDADDPCWKLSELLTENDDD